MAIAKFPSNNSNNKPKIAGSKVSKKAYEAYLETIRLKNQAEKQLVAARAEAQESHSRQKAIYSLEAKLRQQELETQKWMTSSNNLKTLTETQRKQLETSEKQINKYKSLIKSFTTKLSELSGLSQKLPTLQEVEALATTLNQHPLLTSLQSKSIIHDYTQGRKSLKQIQDGLSSLF